MAVLSLFAILVMVALILFFRQRIRAGHAVHLRRIPALDHLAHLVSRAVEGGRQIHVSLGTGGISGASTATTLAGLAVLDHLADRGCGSGAPPLVTVADPMVLPAAQDSLRQAYARHGKLDTFELTQVEMIAPQPVIYALGASTHLERDATAANLMVGSFGREALLLAEPGAHNGVTQLAGTDDPEAMALLESAVDAPIVGEELFAVPAYLARRPEHLASLQAQDVMRIGVAALIVIAALLRSLGVPIF